MEEDSKHNLVGELYETRIRMDEIQQFAANVVPKPRFIFDSYKVQNKPNWDDSFSESEQEYTNQIDEVQEAIGKITQDNLAQK